MNERYGILWSNDQSFKVQGIWEETQSQNNNRKLFHFQSKDIESISGTGSMAQRADVGQLITGNPGVH